MLTYLVSYRIFHIPDGYYRQEWNEIKTYDSVLDKYVFSIYPTNNTGIYGSTTYDDYRNIYLVSLFEH